MAETDTPMQPVVDPHAVLRAQIAGQVFCTLITCAAKAGNPMQLREFAAAAAGATDILLEALNG